MRLVSDSLAVYLLFYTIQCIRTNKKLKIIKKKKEKFIGQKFAHFKNTIGDEFISSVQVSVSRIL